MKDNLRSYTQIDKDKKKKSQIFPDVKGSIDSFNHSMQFNDGSCTTAMAEDISDDTIHSKDIYNAILNQFKTSEKPIMGACYILPDGLFLDPGNAHGNVDEFVISNFPEIDQEDYLNGYLMDAEQCVRLNDGRAGSFTFDRYITLPNVITSNQIYAIKDWLEEYPYDEITVSSVNGSMVEFNLSDGISRIMNRIKKYKASNILAEDIDEKELPDLLDDNIIEEEDAGVSSMFIDAINSCWSSIDDYHSILVTLDALDRHEYDDILNDLLEQKNKEVGALQGILEVLTPSGDQIEQGKEEAQDQIAFDSVEESFDLYPSKNKFNTDSINEDFQIINGRKNKIDFRGKDLTLDNIVEWIKLKNTKVYNNKLCEELKLDSNFSVKDQLTRRQVFNVLRESKLEQKLCDDFGIKESDLHKAYWNM